MPYNKDPRLSGDQSRRGYHQLSVGTVCICSTHFVDLLALFLNALQILALDLNHGIRIGISRFSHMATEGFARFAVHHMDVLMGHVTAPIITLKVRGVLRPFGNYLLGKRFVDRHEAPLFVRVLMASAVMNMLGVMRIVPRTIATQFMHLGSLVVVVLARMIDAGTFLGGHLVEGVGEVLAQMAFLGVSVQDLFVPFHVVNVFAQDLSVRPISKCLGRDNHGGFSQSGMAGGLDGSSADGSDVFDVQLLLGGLHGFLPLVGCARDWAVSAGYRHNTMIGSLLGGTSG